MAFVLKTCYNNDIRRVMIDPVDGFTYTDLRVLLLKQFPNISAISVTHYVDDDKDMVRITEDSELAEAFRIAREMGLKSLKIIVSNKVMEKNTDTPTPSTPSAETDAPTAASAPPSIHYGFTCDASGIRPIVGPRYHKRGTNYDLCEAEFLKLEKDDQTVFEKIDEVQPRAWWGKFKNQRTREQAQGWRRHGQGWGGRQGGHGRNWGGRPGGRSGGPCGGHGGRRAHRWHGGNPLLKKCKWAFHALKTADLGPLLTTLYNAGGAAAEACGPLKTLAAVLRNEPNLQVLRRIRQSPIMQKLKVQLREVHQKVQSGALSFFAAPAAVLGSDAWALAISQLREDLPQAAIAVEKLSGLAGRLQAEIPLLLPQLIPVIMQLHSQQPWHAGPGKQKKKFKAKFVSDNTIPDGSVVTTSTKFLKTWTVSNSGDGAWPEDTALLHVGGDMELRPTKPRVAIGAVAPGMEHIVSVELKSPPKAGRYWSYWRLVAGGDPSAERFGIKLWADVTVADDDFTVAKTGMEPAATVPILGTASLMTNTTTGVPADVNVSAPTSPISIDSAIGGLGSAVCSLFPTSTAAAKTEAADNSILNETLSDLPAVPTTLPTPAVSAPVMDTLGEILTDTLSAIAATEPSAPSQAMASKWMKETALLTAMGFDPAKFAGLLETHGGNVQKVALDLMKGQMQ
jgi:hypothetical protein